MKADCYLVFDRSGVLRTTKGLPDMKAGQFAVRLRLEIPDAVFRPDVPEVGVIIPERAMLRPTVTVDEVGGSQPITHINGYGDVINNVATEAPSP